MLFQLVSVVLSSCQRKARRNNPLDRRIVSKVKEKRDTIETAVRLKIFLEEPGRFHVHTHSGEHDRKIVFMTIMHVFGGTLDKSCLPYDLGGNLRQLVHFRNDRTRLSYFVVRQTGS